MNPTIKSLITLAAAAKVALQLTVSETGIVATIRASRGSPAVMRETTCYIDCNEPDPDGVLTEAVKRVQ